MSFVVKCGLAQPDPIYLFFNNKMLLKSYAADYALLICPKRASSFEKAQA